MKNQGRAQAQPAEAGPAQAQIEEPSPQLLEKYFLVRRYSEALCAPLATEDHVAQPMTDVSPPKWHLAHTSWFFEEFVLAPFVDTYRVFHEKYRYLFNSYYESVGPRHNRPRRGSATRPTVGEIYTYREAVDRSMRALLTSHNLHEGLRERVILGLHHEEQHQELLVTDIKYILGTQPLKPPYGTTIRENLSPPAEDRWVEIPAGTYEIGCAGNGFCFDNEKPRHKVYIEDARIRTTLVCNGEFTAFIADGGYRDFRHWLSDGWAWVQENRIKAPLYWNEENGEWQGYTLAGITPLDPEAPVMHVSYYEAAAFASWRSLRLPSEQEWEIGQASFSPGQRWEWTQSAYLPYPGYRPPEGVIGEYNGKFMSSQMVLRGPSVATPPGHGRPTYRNFFYPHQRWQFTGIRLAQ